MNRATAVLWGAAATSRAQPHPTNMSDTGQWITCLTCPCYLTVVEFSVWCLSCCQTIVAVINLGERERDTLEGRSRQRPLGQSAAQVEIASEPKRAVGENQKHVWYPTQVLLNRLRDRPGLGRGLLDAFR